MEGTDRTIERDELDELAACLGAGWCDLQGLNVEESVRLAILLVNEKLRDVPGEVRDFFGAPRTLEPFLPYGPIFNERCFVAGRA